MSACVDSRGELSYLVGPAVVILCAAQTSPGVVAWGLGAAIAAGGVGIAVPAARLTATYSSHSV